MSEKLSENTDPSPTTTEWSVLEEVYDKETDVNQVNPETTTEQLDKAVMGVIAAREELFKLSEESRKNPGDDEVWQATSRKAVELQDLIRQRNELANKIVNDRPVE